MVASSFTSRVDNINNVTNKNASETDKAAAKAQTNYQDFLKLLTTQLQNQDPTAPTDTNQLTQQIATLSQVEQQINTNSNLQKLISLFNTSTLNSVVGYIGKQVEADGDKGVMQGGKASFVYDLEKEAQTVDLTILDPTGKEVMKANGTKVAGRNEVLWGGKDGDGKQLADGTYTIKVVAKDAAGNDLKAKTSTVGVVSSIDTKDGTTVLTLGDVVVALDKVKSVRQAI
ncbi:MAG: flagellar hook assembly protein FlgD [Pseudomonadota bacterium]